MTNHCNLMAVVFALAGTCVAQTSRPEQPGDTGGRPVITVEAPGDAPQRALRLAPRAGTKQAFDVRVTREGLDEDANVPQAPAMTWTFATVVDGPPEGGEVKSEFKVGAALCVEVSELAKEFPNAPAHIQQALARERVRAECA